MSADNKQVNRQIMTSRILAMSQLGLLVSYATFENKFAYLVKNRKDFRKGILKEKRFAKHAKTIGTTTVQMTVSDNETSIDNRVLKVNTATSGRWSTLEALGLSNIGTDLYSLSKELSVYLNNKNPFNETITFTRSGFASGDQQLFKGIKVQYADGKIIDWSSHGNFMLNHAIIASMTAKESRQTSSVYSRMIELVSKRQDNRTNNDDFGNDMTKARYMEHLQYTLEKLFGHDQLEAIKQQLLKTLTNLQAKCVKRNGSQSKLNIILHIPEWRGHSFDINAKLNISYLLEKLTISSRSKLKGTPDIKELYVPLSSLAYDLRNSLIQAIVQNLDDFYHFATPQSVLKTEITRGDLVELSRNSTALKKFGAQYGKTKLPVAFAICKSNIELSIVDNKKPVNKNLDKDSYDDWYQRYSPNWTYADVVSMSSYYIVKAAVNEVLLSGDEQANVNLKGHFRAADIPWNGQLVSAQIDLSKVNLNLSIVQAGSTHVGAAKTKTLYSYVYQALSKAIKKQLFYALARLSNGYEETFAVGYAGKANLEEEKQEDKSNSPIIDLKLSGEVRLSPDNKPKLYIVPDEKSRIAANETNFFNSSISRVFKSIDDLNSIDIISYLKPEFTRALLELLPTGTAIVDRSGYNTDQICLEAGLNDIVVRASDNLPSSRYDYYNGGYVRPDNLDSFEKLDSWIKSQPSINEYLSDHCFYVQANNSIRNKIDRHGKQA